MFHRRDGARMHVLYLGCLSWNDRSSLVCVLKEGDGASQAGMVADGIWWWDLWVSDTQFKKVHEHGHKPPSALSNLFLKKF